MCGQVHGVTDGHDGVCEPYTLAGWPWDGRLVPVGCRANARGQVRAGGVACSTGGPEASRCQHGRDSLHARPIFFFFAAAPPKPTISGNGSLALPQ